MKILVLGAGAGTSTKDVENGVVEGLREAGVEVGRYTLDQRLLSSQAYLQHVYRRARRRAPDTPEPSHVEVALHALNDMLPRAIAHHVDWVLVVTGMCVPLAFVDVMQQAGLAVALLATESPYDQGHEVNWAQFADLIWTTERSSVPAFQRVQPATSYLRHAWRPSVHHAGAEDAQVNAHDVVFVGTGFDERLELLEAIDWTGIDFGLYGHWDRLSATSPLRPHLRSSVIDNTQTAALYRRATIGLNLYRQSIGWAPGAARITHAESLSPRAYELAACGCFHLSHARPEVAETFGDLVPTFTTPAECEALIRRWLADAAGRAAVARQLPACVAGHTWTARARQMVDDLRRGLPAARARVVRQAQARLDAVQELPCAS